MPGNVPVRFVYRIKGGERKRPPPYQKAPRSINRSSSKKTVPAVAERQLLFDTKSETGATNFRSALLHGIRFTARCIKITEGIFCINLAGIGGRQEGIPQT